MTPVTSFAGKTVAVFGLGGSGLASCHALKAGGAEVIACDDSADKMADAARAGFITADLRTDMLVCITRHWMRSDETLNIYSWWTSQKSQPVSLFSCAGFDELPPAGRLTDRVIANALVTVLAGNRAGLDSHTRGAKTCPFDYNAKRSLRHMAGFQKFDARCRAALARKMPTELPALESLLNTFH